MSCFNLSLSASFQTAVVIYNFSLPNQNVACNSNNNFFRATSCPFKSCSSPVPHVDEGEGSVQGGHEDVGEGEVEQEVVCHTPHSSMGTHCPEHLGEMSYRVFFN